MDVYVRNSNTAEMSWINKKELAISQSSLQTQMIVQHNLWWGPEMPLDKEKEKKHPKTYFKK